MKAVAQAGTVNADVVFLSDAPVVIPELLNAGIIGTHVPPRVADRLDAGEKSPLLAQRLSAKVLMYAEDAYPDGAPVDSLRDLTREDWKGICALLHRHVGLPPRQVIPLAPASLTALRLSGDGQGPRLELSNWRPTTLDLAAPD